LAAKIYIPAKLLLEMFSKSLNMQIKEYFTWRTSFDLSRRSCHVPSHCYVNIWTVISDYLLAMALFSPHQKIWAMPLVAVNQTQK